MAESLAKSSNDLKWSSKQLEDCIGEDPSDVRSFLLFISIGMVILGSSFIIFGYLGQ
jgi:hypothetical protein